MCMLCRFYFLVLFCLGVSHAGAQSIKLTDMAGRTVVLKKPAAKILLGEGRDIITLNLLDTNPVSLIAGWSGDFKKTQEYKAYAHKFPAIAGIPVTGTSRETFSVEKAIACKPDLAVFSIKGHGPGPEDKDLIRQLESAGIPVVFIDFRSDPFRNTLPSIILLGKALARESRAAAYTAFYESRKKRIADRIARSKPKAPKVFMDMKAGNAENQFFSPGKGNLGDYIEWAGAENIGAKVLPGPLGQLNAEYIIAARPEIYIATGADVFRGKGMVLGKDVTPDEAKTTLKQRIAHPVLAAIPAVKNKKVYGLWHLFYASPLNILAAEAIATWVHPTLFSDISPEASLEELNRNFLSVPMIGTYWVEL